jgi:hypothetical protein
VTDLPRLESDEIDVICTGCNGFLHNDVAATPQERSSGARQVRCPYACTPNGDGTIAMTIPPGEQRYGRS